MTTGQVSLLWSKALVGESKFQQRRADVHLCLFYKMVYGFVAVPHPDYIQPSNRVEYPGTVTH